MALKKKEQKFIPRAKRKSALLRQSVHNPRDQKFYAKIIYYFLLALFVAAVVYVLVYAPFLRVNGLIVKGTKDISCDEIVEHISQSLSGYWAFVIPKNNILAISKERLRSDLADSFKKIASVSVSKKFPNILEVEIGERQSLLVLCSGDIADNCYIVDDSGIAYEKADFDSAEIKENNLVKLIDTSGKSIGKGDQILLGDYISLVLNIKKEFADKLGMNIIPEYRTPSRLAGEIRLRAENGVEFWIPSQVPLGDILRSADIFLKEKKMDDLSQLEYVDLRVENKVYYKLKNVPEEQRENQTEEVKNNDKNKN